jgi:hypothetical protein
MEAGLPFPNFGMEILPGVAGNAPSKPRIKTVDMWLGPTRFVIPAEVAYSNGAYPEHHPRHYEGLRGSLPHFYPTGPVAGEIDGMGSMVDVDFQCSMDEKYAASWGHGYKSNIEGIEKVKATYHADAARFDSKRSNPSKISINRRDDIGMNEVLYERGQGKYNDGRPMWEATYWPLNTELKSFDGSISGIHCDTRHDLEHRYSKQGWRCTSGMRITPNSVAHISIYVSHIEDMPSVFEQVRQIFINAQQATGK